MSKTPSSGSTRAATSPNEYSVDELARVTGATVRNIRAYQDRGLLSAPAKRGRTAVYDDTHVARLKLVNHLLARGYTLANIQDLIQAIEEGHDLRSILGLENAIGSRWSHERPQTYTLSALAERFGGPSAARLAQALQLGLVQRSGATFVAPSPAALQAGAALVEEGVPSDDLLDALRISRPHFEAVAKALVDLVVRRLDRYDAHALPPPADVPALVEAIWRLRPLAMVLVETEMNRALEEASGDYLADRVSSILDKRLARTKADSPPKTRRKRAR